VAEYGRAEEGTEEYGIDEYGALSGRAMGRWRGSEPVLPGCAGKGSGAPEEVRPAGARSRHRRLGGRPGRATRRCHRNALARPGRVVLELAWRLTAAVVMVRAEARAGRASRAVERLPGVAPADQQAAGKQVFVAGHEDALDAPASLLQTRLGL
jgi:hypothetical protein